MVYVLGHMQTTRRARLHAHGDGDHRAKLSQRMRERWQDPEYRAKALKHLNESRALQTEETRRKISETMKRVWEQVRAGWLTKGACIRVANGWD